MDHYQLEKDPSEDNDWGHVHANSLIPSHAFFAALKGSNMKTWEAIARIWFNALSNPDQEENFNTFALKTLNLALLRKDNSISSRIFFGWSHVEVFKSAVPRPLSNIMPLDQHKSPQSGII